MIRSIIIAAALSLSASAFATESAQSQRLAPVDTVIKLLQIETDAAPMCKFPGAICSRDVECCSYNCDPSIDRCGDRRH